MAVDWERRPQPVPGVEINYVDEGIVAYSPAADRVHYLNESASVILTLCDGQRSLREISQFLAQAWSLDAAPDQEVEACFDQLLREALVQ